MKLLTYQNKRGGKVEYFDVPKPNPSQWETAKDAMNDALKLEKKVNEVNKI